jgi:hypothetical protein
MAIRRGLASLASALVIALVVAVVYWPGLGGFWTRDDYMQLAFARLVGSPWPVFAHDHYFPVPGSIFRPVGFASFWVSQALFGIDYFQNALGDLALHVAVSLALYRVIRAGAIERVPAVLCTLLFAVHPAVLGTALWWSARFDLLAMLFGLIAVRAALDYAARPRIGSLLVALAAVLAALLSKETALAAAAAVGFVWLRGARADRSRFRALVALLAVVALFFAWRTAVLGTVTTSLTGGRSIVDAFGSGFMAWSWHLVDYVTYGTRAGIVLALAACTYFGFEFERRTRGRSRAKAVPSARVDLLVCGLCFFVLPAILQAPIAALNAAPLSAGASAVEAAMQSRLYYFSIGGLAMLFAGGLGRVWPSARVPRTALSVVLTSCVIAFGWVSHGTAVAFAATTAASRPIAESIANAIDHAPSAGERCRVVVLGVQPPPEWSIYVSTDSIAKALTTDVDRVGRCFIESDYATYFNLMRGDAEPADAMPYTPRSASGRPIPWLRIGEITTAYLDPPTSSLDATTLAGIVFLRYENGAFVDATADVAAGRVPVTLR